MGAITISFLHDPKSNRHEIWVDYESESDWLPAEHERRHRQIVRRLFEEGRLDPEQVDRIHVRVEGEEITIEELDEDFREAPQKEKA